MNDISALKDLDHQVEIDDLSVPCVKTESTVNDDSSIVRSKQDKGCYTSTGYTIRYCRSTRGCVRNRNVILLLQIHPALHSGSFPEKKTRMRLQGDIYIYIYIYLVYIIDIYTDVTDTQRKQRQHSHPGQVISSRFMIYCRTFEGRSTV